MLKRLQLLFLGLLLFLQIGISQVEDTISFAFINNPDGSGGKTWLLEEPEYKSYYKFKVAQQVFDDLIEARGDYRMRIPDLVFSEAERRVAYAKPSKAQIVLEEKAYDLCTTFGKDSLNVLAALLAHELIHYYEKHDWTYRMVKDFEGLKTSEQLQAASERLKFEAQADLLGGFLAYAAGYQPLGLMPDFLTKVYQNYGLQEEIRGYPSLSDRKAFASRSLEQVEQLAKVFEAANYFSAIGQYEQAKATLEYILKDFQSRELYNNLGVVATLAAMELFSPQELRLAYPVELDARSRLQRINRGAVTDDRLRIRKLLLEEALNYFEQAAVLDPDYPNAVLNKACVLALQEQLEDATYFADKAFRMAKKEASYAKTLSDILILKGVVAYQQGEVEPAKRFFRSALQVGNDLGELNLQMVAQKVVTLKPSLPDTLFRETIEGQSLDAAANSLLMGTLKLHESIQLDKQTLFGIQQLDQSQIWLHFQAERGDYTLLHLTGKNYDQPSSQGVTPGAPKTAVERAYGTPPRRVQTSTGTFWVYPIRKLLFCFDTENQLMQWGSFRISSQ